MYINRNTQGFNTQLLTLPSGNSRNGPDAPPVLAAEFIITHLSASHLAFCLQNFRPRDYELFVPYLVQADCAYGILRAVLLEYNGETPKEYLERLIADTINGNEPERLLQHGVMNIVLGLSADMYGQEISFVRQASIRRIFSMLP